MIVRLSCALVSAGTLLSSAAYAADRGYASAEKMGFLQMDTPQNEELVQIAEDWQTYQVERRQQQLYETRQSDPNLVVVNHWHPLPDDYTVNLVSVGDGEMDERAAGALREMLSDGRAAGMRLQLISTYRTYAYQSNLFQRQLSRRYAAGYTGEEAIAAACRIVAYPGTSEHHTGLAADIVSYGYDTSLLTRDYEYTEEAQWLSAHCADYGFILRYPDGKSDITGVIYEPWHYRYVGVEAAHEIMNSGLCLEEYVGLVDSE